MVKLQGVQRHTGRTHIFFNFRHSGALALSPERQSARMSKIKNGGLDQYGPERFGRLILLYSQKNAGLKGLNHSKRIPCVDVAVFSSEVSLNVFFSILLLSVSNCPFPFYPIHASRLYFHYLPMQSQWLYSTCVLCQSQTSILSHMFLFFINNRHHETNGLQIIQRIW